MSNIRFLLFIPWLGILLSAGADEKCPIFVFEKSFNADNVLCVFAQLDEKGGFVTLEKGNYFIGYHWLMDRKDYKPVHPLIKSRIRERLELTEQRPAERKLIYLFNDLKELKHDLTDPMIELLVVRKEDGGLGVEARVQLGESHENQILVLSSIYSKVHSWARIPTGIDYVELRGTSLETGEEIKARYHAKSSASVVAIKRP